MPTVHIPSALRGQSGGVAQLEIAGETLRDVVNALEERFPGIARHLAEGDALARGLAASIDGQMTNRGLWARVRPESEIHFLPAIGGGC
ncbi:MAG: MoaD/ThiS family protein [Planctomycetaceae bacterium]|nr:MoaD/ThiS family protein [Planctomycetaceae bacterium]